MFKKYTAQKNEVVRNEVIKIGKVSKDTLGNPNHLGVEKEKPRWQDFR